MCLTVGVVRREESTERLMWRAPERPQQVVTSTVVHAVECMRRASHVDRVRTLQWIRLRQHVSFQHRIRVLLQHLGHQLQQLSDLGVRHWKSKGCTRWAQVSKVTSRMSRVVWGPCYVSIESLHFSTQNGSVRKILVVRTKSDRTSVTQSLAYLNINL